jgi:hypothetical protein
MAAEDRRLSVADCAAFIAARNGPIPLGRHWHALPWILYRGTAIPGFLPGGGGFSGNVST